MRLEVILTVGYQSQLKHPCYLQQFEGGQQLPCCAVPSVHLVVLQLRGEPRRAIVLVAHLDRGLGKRAANELGFTLNTVKWQQADEVDGTRDGELDAGEGGAVGEVNFLDVICLKAQCVSCMDFFCCIFGMNKLNVYVFLIQIASNINCLFGQKISRVITLKMIL